MMFTYIQNFDTAALLWIESIRMEWLDSCMMLYTTIGDAGILWIVISLVMMCLPQTRRAGCLALLAMGLGLVCNNIILKELVARPRPYLVIESLQPLLSPPDPNSFPSGHTCAAFAAAVVWWNVLSTRWIRIVFMTMAVTMGISRLWVGVHFPTDVLVGALVGTLCALVVYQVAKKFTQPDDKRYRGKIH